MSDILLDNLKEIKEFIHEQNGRVRKSEEDLAALKEWKNTINTKQQEILIAIRDLEQNVNQKFDKVESQIQRIQEKFEQIKEYQDKNIDFLEYIKRNWLAFVVLLTLLANEFRVLHILR